MSESKVKDRFAAHRVVFRVPEYMSELREELMSLPENQWSKRILHLALIGLTVSKVGGVANASITNITTSKGGGKTLASTIKAVKDEAPEPTPIAAEEVALAISAQAPSPDNDTQDEMRNTRTLGTVEHQNMKSTLNEVAHIGEVVETEGKQPPQKSTDNVGKRRNRLPTMPIMTQ